MTVVAREPDLDRARARRIRRPLGAAAAVGIASLALQARDPHRHGSWGLCPFKLVTGWDCPLCGGLRSVNDLGAGRLVDAAHSNLLFVAALPLAAVLWALWLSGAWSGRPVALPARVVRPLLVGSGVLVLAFTVYRNTPWGSAWHVS
jgi:hypothetical protein